jgi:hypothetical protein
MSLVCCADSCRMPTRMKINSVTCLGEEWRSIVPFGIVLERN